MESTSKHQIILAYYVPFQTQDTARLQIFPES